MHCPNCGNQVPARPMCLRCGVPLFGNPALPASAQGPVLVPLTLSQKARLLAGCWPLISSALVVVGYLALVLSAIAPAPPPLLALVLGLVLLMTGYQALQRLRDLRSGVALAQEDLLNSSFRADGGNGRGTSYGRFERLGTLQIISKVYSQNSSGQRYRVVYSPASKIVWALEPPDPRIYY